MSRKQVLNAFSVASSSQLSYIFYRFLYRSMISAKIKGKWSNPEKGKYPPLHFHVVALWVAFDYSQLTLLTYDGIICSVETI